MVHTLLPCVAWLTERLTRSRSVIESAQEPRKPRSISTLAGTRGSCSSVKAMLTHYNGLSMRQRMKMSRITGML